MNWFSSSGFLKAAVESATNLTKSLIQDDFIEDSDADDSPAVPRLKQSNSLPNEDEEEAGITPQLIEFVHNVLLYPKTFTDFPLDAQIKGNINVIMIIRKIHSFVANFCSNQLSDRPNHSCRMARETCTFNYQKSS